MLLKLVTAAIAALIIWLVFFRVSKVVRGTNDSSAGKPKRVKAQDLVKCPGCGIFMPADRPCDCVKKP